MPWLAVAAMAGGTALQVMSTLEEGKQAAKTGKLQQRQYEQDARATEEAGKYDIELKRKEGARLKATQIAQMAASGGIISGTNLEILADSAREVELDAQAIYRNTNARATGLRNQGKIARYQGRYARYGSRIRAFATGLQGAGMMGLMYGMSAGGGTGIGQGGSSAGTGAASKGWSANNNFGTGLNRNF